VSAAPSPPNPAFRFVRLGRRRRPLGDLYHFLLTISWSRLIGLIVVGFVAANAVFAALYLFGGPDTIEGAQPGSFADAFFFSVQTMATIGYGKMGPHTPYAHVIVTTEAFVGLLGFATATGLLFSKFSRPTARVMFSRNVVMTTWEGEPALMFRMANERVNQIVEAQCNVAVLKDEITSDGHEVRRVHDLPLMRQRSPVFSLSWTAVHVIGKHSPLHGLDAAALEKIDAFFVVTFTGIDETFSQTVHARYGWTWDQVIWNARMADIFTTLPDGRDAIDYTKFHDVIKDADRLARSA
jgi:inward rectifier potassium channel